MNISGIPGAIGSLGSAAAAGSAQSGAAQNGAAQGGDAFGGLLASLTGSAQASDRAVTDIATGSERDLHDAVMSVQMESLTFDLAVQIRNRMVDAFQEVFRMSV